MKVAAVSEGPSLFRILGFERVVEIFETNELHFSHPSSWEDPYEAKLRHHASAQVFAQCWCKNGVSDAMWRIYSPTKLGVRIRTSKSRLKSQLIAACRSQGLHLSLQDVRYLNEANLNHELECIADSLAESFTISTAARALLVKRRAFRHEAEIRAVVSCNTAPQNPSAGMKLTVNPHKLIESILVDPRAPDAYVRAYRHVLVKELGFGGPVHKSGLYADHEPLEVA